MNRRLFARVFLSVQKTTVIIIPTEQLLINSERSELFQLLAERSIKPFVIGRKNFLFANTPHGAQSSAVIYSMIETAKANDLDPYRYLTWVLTNAPVLAAKGEDWEASLLPTKAPPTYRTIQKNI